MHIRRNFPTYDTTNLKKILNVFINPTMALDSSTLIGDLIHLVKKESSILFINPYTDYLTVVLIRDMLREANITFIHDSEDSVDELKKHLECVSTTDLNHVIMGDPDWTPSKYDVIIVGSIPDMGVLSTLLKFMKDNGVMYTREDESYMRVDKREGVRTWVSLKNFRFYNEKAMFRPLTEKMIAYLVDDPLPSPDISSPVEDDSSTNSENEPTMTASTSKSEDLFQELLTALNYTCKGGGQECIDSFKRNPMSHHRPTCLFSKKIKCIYPRCRQIKLPEDYMNHFMHHPIKMENFPMTIEKVITTKNVNSFTEVCLRRDAKNVFEFMFYADLQNLILTVRFVGSMQDYSNYSVQICVTINKEKVKFQTQPFWLHVTVNEMLTFPNFKYPLKSLKKICAEKEFKITITVRENLENDCIKKIQKKGSLRSR